MAVYTGTPALPALLAGDVPQAATDWAAIVGALHGVTDASVPWTATLANLTLGNGTLATTYIQSGKWVDYRFKFTLGSTSAVGTGPTFTLPVAPHAGYVAFTDLLGDGILRDNSALQYRAAAWLTGGSTVQIIHSSTTLVTITATVPFTWTTPDVLSISGRYEAV